MRPRFALALFPLTIIIACTQFPQLDDAVSTDARDAPYPDLVPVENIQNQVPETQVEPTTVEEVEARAARLKERAQQLRGPVVDDATHRRMKQGVQ